MRTNEIEGNLFRLLGALTRLGFGFILLLGLAGAVMAYTVVFRDGQKIVVPSAFIVTSTTLTFEAAPGINRTVQLVLIDVAATELANNEAPGSFFKHTESKSIDSPSTLHPVHTLTNRDLESIRQRRLESEKNYEKRRIELGLPSLEETSKRQALEEESTLELVRRRAAASANDEAYWRSRAGALRNEILTVDAEINYLRARIGHPVSQVPFITQGFVTGVGSFGRQFPGRLAQPGAGRPGIQAAGASRLTNLGARAVNPSRPSAGFFPRAGFGSAFPILPFGYADNLYDLNLRLNELLTQRAGLDALWRQLENEARIAQAPQVWLAP